MKPFRVFQIVKWILAVLILFSNPGWCQTDSETDSGRITSISVAISPDSAPYYFVDSRGQAQGWLVDLWRLWGKKNDIQIVFKPATFEETVPMVAGGEADLHAGLFYSEKRDDLLDFVLPVVEVSTHCYYSKGIPGIHSLSDLRPYRIGVLGGDHAVEYLGEHLPGAALAEFPDNSAMFDALAAGEIKAFVKDTAIARNFLSDRGLLDDYSCFSAPLYVKAFNAAVRQGNHRLSRLISGGMTHISPEEKAAIDRKWSGSAQTKTDEVLVVACREDNAPFSMLTRDGEPGGLLVDLWRLWSEKTERPVEFRFFSSQGLMDAAVDEKADIYTMTEADALAAGLEAASPLFPVASALFYPAGETAASFDNLHGSLVGVLGSGYHQARLEKNHPGLSPSSFNTPSAMALATANGTIRAFVGEIVPTRAAIDRLGLSGQLAMTEPLYTEFLRPCVAPSHPDLLATVETGMSTISNTEILNLERRWISDPSQRLFAQTPRQRPLSDEEKAWLADHPVIRIGVDANWPPYEYVDGKNAYKGIASDYVRLINERLGIEMVPQFGLSWPEVLQEAREGGLDVVSCITPSEERGTYLEFSTPYLSVRNVVLSREDSPVFSGLEDLAGRKVAVVDGYLVQQSIASDYPGVILEAVDNIEAGIRAVSQGRVDAYVDTLTSISYTVQKLGLENVMVSATTEYIDELGFGIRKDWAILAGILDKTLESIPEQEKQEIVSRWVGVQVEWHVNWPFIWRTIAAVIGISLVVLCLIAFWNRRLAREVKCRKAAEAALGDQLMLLETLIDTLPNPIFITDADTRYSGCNRAYETAFGIDRGEIIGKTFRDILQLPEAKQRVFLAEDQTVLKKGKPVHAEVTVRFADGERHDVLFWKVPLRFSGDRPGGMVGLMVDISDRKKMEAEIVSAKNRAEEATRAKSSFLANMSHEIRTPMNAIMGMTHLALKTELTPKQLDYLKKIDSSARILLRLINDILDFSKIEARKLTIEAIPFHLDEVFQSLSTLVADPIQEKGLEFLFDIAPETPANLVGDPLRIGQVLNNLVFNALKFTETGEIVVAVRPVEQSDDRAVLQFEVRDTGIGLTETEQKTLFEAFSQADASTTRKYGGTGLGLAICQRLLERMEGRIWVESRRGRGSRFLFTAAFGRHQKPGRIPKNLCDTLKGVPVLVVDDNPTSRKVLSETLESFGFRVTVAASGAEALDRMETAGSEKPFELVLMDWKMPGLDGIETSRRIKGHAALKHAPTIIMVTAHGREVVMKEANRAGLDGFLIKPVSPSVLFNTIIAALGDGEEKKPAPTVETDIPEEITARIRGAHVLVVEDNEINQQVAREILENAGLRVSVADNGQTALEKLEHNLFHAVLMDIQMPVMDGFAATDAIRNSPLLKSIPVIAMTAHAMSGDREKGLAAGMDDYVTKPIDPENLTQTLAKWIRIGNQTGRNAGGRVFRPQPPVELPETLDGIDMETGLVRVGGNRHLFRNLLVKFRTDYAGAATELATLIKRGSLEDARRLAHSIKSVAGNLGAEELAGAAGNLEAAIVRDNADASPQAIDTFTRKLKRTVAALQAVNASPDAVQNAVKTAAGETSGAAPVSPEHLSAIQELEPHARARRPKPCAAGLERITRLTWPEDLAPEVDQLVKKVQKYRYKDALEILDRLKERLAT